SYSWDHYGDLDPDESNDGPRPGALLRLLEHGLAMAGEFPAGPLLDIGCAVGRSAFALAERYERLVLGIDLNYALLRQAQRVLREGRVRYPRRRVGVVYDRRDFPVSWKHMQLVDFWACDAAALPFEDRRFAAATGMNLLDCVPSPWDLLNSLATALQTGGAAVLACPYDWSSSATPLEGWLGGHSQRSPEAGASEAMLRRLLTAGQPQAIPGLRLEAEDEHEWQVRLHDRSVVAYQSHLVVARREGE
ncbi:MAG: methyltransferase domain-containing protein, partial [Planctomycetales bacterium]|nr:methyltransferase domain-containing protein [Planctomycetales bacterium]